MVKKNLTSKIFRRFIDMHRRWYCFLSYLLKSVVRFFRWLRLAKFYTSAKPNKGKSNKRTTKAHFISQSATTQQHFYYSTTLDPPPTKSNVEWTSCKFWHKINVIGHQLSGEHKLHSTKRQNTWHTIKKTRTYHIKYVKRNTLDERNKLDEPNDCNRQKKHQQYKDYLGLPRHEATLRSRDIVKVDRMLSNLLVKFWAISASVSCISSWSSACLEVSGSGEKFRPGDEDMSLCLSPLISCADEPTEERDELDMLSPISWLSLFSMGSVVSQCSILIVGISSLASASSVTSISMSSWFSFRSVPNKMAANLFSKPGYTECHFLCYDIHTC